MTFRIYYNRSAARCVVATPDRTYNTQHLNCKVPVHSVFAPVHPHFCLQGECEKITVSPRKIDIE